MVKDVYKLGDNPFSFSQIKNFFSAAASLLGKGLKWLKFQTYQIYITAEQLAINSIKLIYQKRLPEYQLQKIRKRIKKNW